ncbi:MAG: serine/threonine protein kinase [Alphaproteobacteria bacterium]|nr:serine/threonine protein kinase [Alphaproteobacteria bacterium]MCB9700047.1 serine/threonine protein kinase [Alphaproteobacteria bacterium]
MGLSAEMTAQPFVVGEGRYEVDAPIGYGAMGTVYRARDVSNGDAIALKVLDPRVVGSKVEKRFLREGEAMRRLKHPNIVRVFEVGQDGGYVWMAMELMDRGNAHELVKKRGALPIPWVLHIADSVLAGLQQVHLAGWVHRDLKPANVLVDSQGGVKLADFGILREDHSDLTMPGSSLGTLAYMSPEQTEDATRVTVRSDLYSLGATLFALSTGKAPRGLAWLEDDDDQAGAYSIVPDPLRPILRKACAFNPSRRYADATEMRAAIRRLLILQQRG